MRIKQAVKSRAVMIVMLALVTLSLYATARYWNGSIANAARNDEPTLFALVTDDADWPMSDPSRGMYSIGSDLEMDQIFKNNSMNGDAAMYADGKYYISKASMVGTFMVTGNQITVFDSETGEVSDTRNMPANFSNVAVAFAHDRVNGVSYVVTYGGNASTYVLNKFDRQNFTYTPLVQLSGAYKVIATGPDGRLYGIKQGSAALNRIDLETGNEERLISWSETPATNSKQAMVYDGSYGQLLWVYTNSNLETCLVGFSVDDDNLRSNKIGDLGKRGIICLHSTSPVVPADAPQNASDLEFMFDEPGSFSGSLSFKVPSLNVEGNELSGDVVARCIVDGEVCVEKEVSPGMMASLPVTFKEVGSHEVAVDITCDGARSERSAINVFVGFDTPAAVNGLKYSMSGDDVLLSWEPAIGVNGGALEQPVSYVVYHDGEEIATVGDTSCTVGIEGEQALHSFGVAALSGGKISDIAEIGNIVAGKPFEAPYYCSFSTPDDFALFTVINANDDRSTWKYMAYYQCAEYNRVYGDGAGDDYLVSPRISLESGCVYSLRFTTRNNGPKPEALEILLSDGALIDDMESGKVLFSRDDLTNRTNETFEVMFTPEEPGIRNLAFHYMTSAENSQNLNLIDIEVERLGATGAPKAVSNLKVVPGADGSLSADISFTLPVEAFDGTPLESIEKAVLYRDGEIINEFMSPAPGAVKTYEDSGLTHAGEYSYSVGVFNNHGCGQILSQIQYIGAMTLPLEYNSFSDFRFRNSNSDEGWRIDNDQLVYDVVNTGHHQDFAYTPYFYLSKGEIVNATFSYEAFDFSESAQSQGFFIGLCNLANSNPQPIYPAFIVGREDRDRTESRRMSIPEDGIYAFCIYYDGYVSSTVNAGIRIENFKIDTDMVPGAPGQISDFDIKVAHDGELRGVFSFKMPVINLGNKPLEGTVGARIYGPGQNLLGEVTDKAPGEICSLELPMTQGVQSYRIVTFNSEGLGGAETRAAFAGIDIPLRVVELLSYPSYDNMSTELSWDVPDVGIHGGWFDSSTLRYRVYVDGEFITETKDKYYVYSVEDMSQRDYQFSVFPVTDEGEGTQCPEVYSFLGTPAGIPFDEDFSDGELHSSPWRFWSSPMPECVWRPVDDFKGYPALRLNAYVLTESEATLPKLSLNDAVRPELTFEMFKYHKFPEAGSYIEIFLSDDEVNYSSLGRYFAESAEECWEKVTVDLSDYSSSPWISIKLYGNVHESVDVAAVRSLRIADAGGVGVDVIRLHNEIVAGGNGCIRILDSDAVADIYSSDGRVVAESVSGTVRVPSGIYIVRINGENSVKVIVR